MQLLEAIYGLVGKRVEPCSNESLKGNWEHATFGGVSNTIKVQGCLKARDMVMGVGCPVGPFSMDFQAEGNRFFLHYKRGSC